MKLKDFSSYISDLLMRHPEYANEEIESVRADGSKPELKFKPRPVNTLNIERNARRKNLKAEIDRLQHELDGMSNASTRSSEPAEK